MYIVLKEAHNLIGMILLFVLFVVVIFVVAQFILKRPFGMHVQIVSLLGMATAHAQIALGFILYFLSPLGSSNFSGEAMGQTISRFYLVEHPIGMILAAVLLTIGYRVGKNEQLSDRKRYIRVLIYYTLGFAITTYMAPWFLWN